MNETTLRAFLDHAHESHAAAPGPVAEGLRARAPSLPTDDEGAEAVRLAEHVMLGHLADAAALQRFLEALPGPRRPWADGLPAGAWPTALARAQWALCALGMQPSGAAPALADGTRWRALQNVVLALVHGGRVAEAAALLRQDEATAAAHADAEARTGYAACANNVAQELREGPRGDAARDALMLEAATIARRAWAVAGTWLHVERADYQLARCHAVLGQAREALRCARACLEACESHAADAVERFFAHEAMLHALRAADDTQAAATQRQRMQALLAEIDDEDMRRWCEGVLRDLQTSP